MFVQAPVHIFISGPHSYILFLRVTPILNGDSSVVRALDYWLKSCGFKSLQEQWDNFSLQGQLSVLLFCYSWHPRVNPTAGKRSSSFCQKCSWQVTAIHTCTLSTWLGITWLWLSILSAWIYGVHRTCADTPTVSGGTNQVTTKQHFNHTAVTISVAFQNALCKDTVTHSESHTTRAQCVCSEAENRAIVAIVKRLRGKTNKQGS